MMSSSDCKALVVASEGGHWVQINRLEDLFIKLDVSYCSTNANLSRGVNGCFYSISDVSRDDIWKLPLVFCQAIKIVLKAKPKVIISTGALPGLVVCGVGRFLGVKTVWIDSIANGRELSFSGRLAKKVVHVCLSQWPDVADREGCEWLGKVI